MPSETFKQLRFMRAELGRHERGEKTRTGLSREEIEEFAHHVKSTKERLKGKSRGMKIRKSMGVSDIEDESDA